MEDKNVIIANAWKTTIPVCARHKEETKMVLNETATEYYCPICKNKISIGVFEKSLDKIAELEHKNYSNLIDSPLLGVSFSIGKAIKVKVVQEDVHRIYRTLSFDNRKAF